MLKSCLFFLATATLAGSCMDPPTKASQPANAVSRVTEQDQLFVLNILIEQLHERLRHREKRMEELDTAVKKIRLELVGMHTNPDFTTGIPGYDTHVKWLAERSAELENEWRKEFIEAAADD